MRLTAISKITKFPISTCLYFRTYTEVPGFREISNWISQMAVEYVDFPRKVAAMNFYPLVNAASSRSRGL